MKIQEPYLVVLIVVICIFILYCFRCYLVRFKKKPDVLIGQAQTKGERKEQEDSFATVLTDNKIMAVLADGMGGYSQGKLASSLAVNSFVRELSRGGNIHPIEVFFRNTALLCNQKVLEKSKGKKLGTTLVAVMIDQGYLYWVSIGDSAIVLFRDKEFINLNQKQIFQRVLEAQYLSGQITESELLKNPKKKRLTNYIGHEAFREIEISNRCLKLKQGDKIILCSDGVYNSLSELEMEEVLSQNITPTQAAEAIIGIIKRKNVSNQDNATIIILEKNNSN